MSVSVWLRHEWVDQRLKWDPEEFGGITHLHIPSDNLWRPDIVLYNKNGLTSHQRLKWDPEEFGGVVYLQTIFGDKISYSIII